MILNILIYTISSLYLLFFLTMLYGLVKMILQKKYEGPPQKISVIVAARNEESNIETLIKAILNQDYANTDYELVIADDRSEDETGDIIQLYCDLYPDNVKKVRINEQKVDLIGKKNALTEAIKVAKYDILVFTDADCTPDSEWLLRMNAAFSTKVDFVAGYSPLILENKLNQGVKNLERAFFFGIAAGSFGIKYPITVTGRNMAYRKSLFNKVNGFSGIGHIRSGDDDLMLLKMKHYIREYAYLLDKTGVVPSKDRNAIKSQANLETRRYSKFKYHPLYVQSISLFAFIYYLMFFTSTILTIMGIMPVSLFFKMIVLKIISELLLITPYLELINKKRLLNYYPILLVYYTIHFLVFAFKGTFGSYRWK